MTAREKSEKTCMAAIVNPLTEADLCGIEAFMGRLNVFVADHHKIHADTDIQGLEGFFLRFEPVRADWEAYLRAHAPNYNVFEILKIRHYEARVHTPFLANLLNPFGSHMQGDLFYQSFLDKVMGVKGLAPFNDINGLKVWGEFGVGDKGRVDILIRNGKRPHCIIIENKINNAPDQKDQLKRYNNYATQAGFTPENYRLIYLTLRPKPQPRTGTLSQDEFNKLTNNEVLRMVSYQREILPWLKGHLQSDHHLPTVLREILKQYILTLQHLLS